jgi:hypothetical protein
MAIIECNEIIVYQHIRLDTDKIFYIGIGRKKRAFNKDCRSNYWKNIVDKANYKVEILYENLNWQEACNIEINLIKKYGRVNNNTGILCNLTDGGEGRYNSKHSKETLVKLSKAKLGKTLSKETKLKMSNNSYRLRKVIDVKTNIIYNSLKEISEIFNIKPSTLSHYLNGSRKNKTTFKYI